MQTKLTEKIPLLNPDGSLNAKGYANQMCVEYNREQVKSFPLKLKEWNFYQAIKGQYSLQVTLGHVSYICSVAAELIDFKTGKKWRIDTMKPFYVPRLDRNPEEDSINEFRSKDINLSYRVTRQMVQIRITGNGKDCGPVDIAIDFENDPNNEKMIICTPFQKPTQFYLNYKENYYVGTGHVKFGELEVDFDGCTGVLDWGRGVWPYCHEWYWGNMTSHIDGIPFAFNIGWGFGDLSNATENMFFYNKKAYKLGVLQVDWDQKDIMKPWKIRDPDGLLDMTFTPIFNHISENKLVIIDTHCDQLYGYFSGTIQTEDGVREFTDHIAFLEHTVNRW